MYVSKCYSNLGWVTPYLVRFKDHEYSLPTRMGVRGGALKKSDWRVIMLCRANMGSENDMLNIHGQAWELPWDPIGFDQTLR